MIRFVNVSTAYKHSSNMSLLCFLKTVMIFVTHIIATTMAMLDVNPQQLQYVADHLTDHKCSQLIDALHQKTFQLPHNHIKTSPKTPPSVTQCLSRLESWSKGPGQNMTVEYLALRLTEIGLPKLSKKVSGLVMKETSEELHRFFLDDPFKEMIPTKSTMVDESDEDNKPDDKILDEEKKSKEDKDDQLFATIVVLATICVSLFAAISVCLLCPQAGQFVCQNACPQLCASCYDVIVDGCQNAWYSTKNNINRYMLVSPKGAGNGGALAV